MEIISASSKRIQDAISRVPRRSLFLRGDWRGYGFQHWRGSCQASSRDLSGQWSSLLCFPYLASAPADQSALHTLMTVLLRPIPRLHRAATGTTALSMQKLRCWYLHALDEAGHQSVAGARPGIASSVRLQSTDARSASQPGPSVGAPISLTLADSPRRVNKSTVKSHPVTSTVRNPDAEFEWARRFRAIDSPSAGFAKLVTGRGFQSPNQVCCAQCDTRRKFRGEWARRFASSIYFPNANLAKRRAGG